VREDPDGGKEAWYVGDARVAAARGLWVEVPAEGEGVSGSSAAFPGVRSRSGRLPPPAYDRKPRTKVLDDNGIQAAALYPQLGLAFTPQMHKLISFDLDAYRLECTRVYNDFIVDWISPDPSRFIPLASMPYWDVDASVAEIERCAPLGFRGIVTTG